MSEAEPMKTDITSIIVVPRWKVPSLDLNSTYAVISITDPPPGGEPARIPTRWGLRGVLPLAFEDFDPPRHPPEALYDGKTTEELSMQPAHGAAVAAFLRGLPPNVITLVIHCEAGASRSPSMAMAIADVCGLDRRQIQWGGLDTVVDPPNRRVYRTTRAALESRTNPTPSRAGAAGPGGEAEVR